MNKRKFKTFDEQIEDYGSYVDDVEISPFEHLDAFLIRDFLYQKRHRLLSRQQKLLQNYDFILIQNAEKIEKHMSRIYNFKSSITIEKEKWWWHLDKIADGTLIITP
jgi:hypothetical protein